MAQPCLYRFREYTRNVPTELTFEDFYFPPTHYLKLIVSESKLHVKTTRNHHTVNPFALMIPSRDLPLFPRVRRSRASDVKIFSADTQIYDCTAELPRKACLSDGTIRFFKPALDKGQIIREVNMHSRIQDAGLEGKIKVPKFHSVLVSKDSKMTIGLLFDLIPAIGESLNSPQCKMAKQHHARWKQQVTTIVEQLHSHDIVWGDVHPGNVVIDKKFDAWVVDFGGGWVEQFVDRKKAGTKERDWQGVRKIFNEWILQQ